MAAIEAHFSIGDIELSIAASRRRDRGWAHSPRRRPLDDCRVYPSVSAEVPTVREFAFGPGDRSGARLASAIASAAVVRDVAALGSLVLFATMLVVLFSSSMA